MARSDRALTVWLVHASEAAPPDPSSDELIAGLGACGHKASRLAANQPLAPRLASDRPDVIHARSLPAAATLAGLPGRKRLPPFVVDCGPTDALTRPISRFLRSDAVDRILVPDEATKVRLVRQGIDPNKVDLLASSPAPDAAARLELLYREVAEYKAIHRHETVPHSIELAEREEG